ncbi:MAG: hypothetical protein GY786_13490 [Proteobacteria bacterium]|nr:hypothetical protein [Pseudomonadota bacterium]
MSTADPILIKKPISLRVVFILNALMGILPFVFYVVVTQKGITIGGLDPIWMTYTGAGYIASFIILVTSILKKNLTLFRMMLFLNILIALPAKAYLGIVVAVVSIVLSFNKKIRAYFHQ